MADSKTKSSFGKSITDVNIGQMVASIGVAIAEAQQAIDMSSLRIAEMFTGEYTDEEGKRRSSLISFDGENLSLLELGFTPTFYQFAETTIEIKVSMSMTTSKEKKGFKFEVEGDSEGSASRDFSAETQHSGSLGGQDELTSEGSSSAKGGISSKSKTSLDVALVGASYASKFQYSAEGSSSVRVRLVPVPAPAILEQRIRASLDRKTAARGAQAGEA